MICLFLKSIMICNIGGALNSSSLDIYRHYNPREDVGNSPCNALRLFQKWKTGTCWNSIQFLANVLNFSICGFKIQRPFKQWFLSSEYYRSIFYRWLSSVLDVNVMITFDFLKYLCFIWFAECYIQLDDWISTMFGAPTPSKICVDLFFTPDDI